MATYITKKAAFTDQNSGNVFILDPANSTLHTVEFAIDISDWTESEGVYTATVQSQYITTTSIELDINYDETIRDNATGDIACHKTSGGGSMTFITTSLPIGQIRGIIPTIMNDDGRVAIVISDNFSAANAGKFLVVDSSGNVGIAENVNYGSANEGKFLSINSSGVAVPTENPNNNLGFYIGNDGKVYQRVRVSQE